MPFAGDITSTANGTLAFSLVTAILYAFMQDNAPSWRRTAAKTAPVLLLGVLSFIEDGPPLLTAALLASAAGDALLAQDGERPFLAGLVAFLLAHILYVGLFVLDWQGTGLLAAEPWRPAAGIVLLLFSAWMLRRLLPVLAHDMRRPVAVYVAAITLMGLAALGVPGWLVAAGAALFVASDAVLASRKFLAVPGSQHRARTGISVWVLYYPAQLMIALAFLV